MTVTKMECPNCHGQLDIPEGMKEGFVSCKFCNTKVYIEPHKPNITQNFNIKEVNYNRPSATVRSESKELNVVAIVIAIGILASTFLFAIILPLLRYRSYSTVISSESYRSAPEEEVMKSFSEVAFSKQFSEITAEDYASLQYLALRRSKDPSDGQDKWRFDYSESVDETGKAVSPKTVYLSGDDYLNEEDLQPFIGLVSLSSDYNLRFSYDDGYSDDLKSLTNLQYLTLGSRSFKEIKNLVANPEQILGLYGVYLTEDSSYRYGEEEEDSADIYKAFSSLRELAVNVDSDFEPGISPLSFFPQLELLALQIGGSRNTPLDLSPLSSLSQCKTLEIDGYYEQGVENVSVLSGMPQIETLMLHQIINLKDLQFAQNMPKLKSLYLEDLPILSLEGLQNLQSLNSLYIDCRDLTNTDALASLSSLQKLGFGYHNYDIPDLHGLSALEEAEIYTVDLKSISNMPSIKSLIIHNQSGEYEADSLRGMNALSELTIIGNGIIGEVGPSLGPVLRELPALEKLIFRDTPMDGYQDYSLALSNTGVKEMYFLPKDLSSTSTSDNPELPLSLSKVEDDHTVEVLQLSRTDFHNLDDDSRNFYPNAKAYLSHFKALKKLYINGNNLENLDCIEGLSTLEELDISDNYLSDVSALRNFPNLKKVKLSGNPVVNAEILPDSVEVVTSLD